MDDLDRILACLDPSDIDGIDSMTSNDRVLGIFRSAATAFPDAAIDVAWTAVADGRIVVAGRFRGTHLGVWRGVEPTGRPVSVLAMLGFHVQSGQILDVNVVTDSLSIAEQIGAVETLAPPACRVGPDGGPQR